MKTWTYRKPPASRIDDLPASMCIFREWREFFRKVQGAAPGSGVVIDVPANRMQRERMNIYRYANRLRVEVATREIDGRLYVIAGRQQRNQDRLKGPKFSYRVASFVQDRRETAASI